MISVVEIVSLPGTSRWWAVSRCQIRIGRRHQGSRAHVIGTNNLSDFPAHVQQARDMEAKGPRIRARQLDLSCETVYAAGQRAADSWAIRCELLPTFFAHSSALESGAAALRA